MRALVFTAPGTVAFDEVTEPNVGPDDVLVHVRMVGICGSELHGVKKPGFRVPPLIMGHEFAGLTDDGRRVMINPVLSCGRCDMCTTGRRQLCRERRLVGVHTSGGFGERVAVPTSAVREIPIGMGWKTAAMVEPIANAVHAWGLADRPAGARVGIVGAGPIGLACMLVAIDGGAKIVEVAERSEARLEVARSLGAARAAQDLDGEFDVTFDAVGSSSSRRAAVTSLRPGGTAVWLGLADETGEVDGSGLVRSEQRIVGSFAYTDDEYMRTAAIIQGWDLGWVSEYPLADGADVFARLMDGATQPVKALLVP